MIGFIQNTALYLMLIAGISPVLYFFPSIEHFPWGLVCLILFFRGALISLLLIFTMIIYFLIGYYAHVVTGGAAGLYNIIKLLNLVSPLLFFSGNEARIGRIARNVFWLYVVVGVLQITHILVPVEDVFRLFIARFDGGPVAGGISYRGVQMLETEPARASYQLLALFILATALTEGWKQRLLVVMIISQFILISSTTGLLLTIIYLVIRFAGRFVRSPQLIVLLLTLSFVLLPNLRDNPKVSLMIEFYQQNGIDGVKTVLAATSGGRFLGMVNTIEAIVDNPLGHGPNPAFFEGEKIEVDAYEVQGYRTRISARPVSSSLTYLYVYGIPIFFLMLFAVRKTVGGFRADANTVFVGIMSVLYSPPGSEMTLLLLLSVVYAANHRHLASKRSNQTSSAIPTSKVSIFP